jgi:hypothetical protein
MSDPSSSEAAKRSTAVSTNNMASAVRNTKPPKALDLDWDDDEDEKPLSDRITNWARVTVDRGWRSSTCMSIEGRYRPERIGEEEEEKRRTPKWTPDVADAWEVEDAWKELSAIFRFCLQFVYLKRWHPRKVRLKLAPYRTRQLKLRDYHEVLRLARFALLNQLRRRKRVT